MASGSKSEGPRVFGKGQRDLPHLKSAAMGLARFITILPMDGQLHSMVQSSANISSYHMFTLLGRSWLFMIRGHNKHNFTVSGVLVVFRKEKKRYLHTYLGKKKLWQ